MKKLPRQATEENETKKKARQCEEPIIHSICGLRHVQVIIWIISALETSKWSQITFFVLTNILNPSPKDLALSFEQIGNLSTDDGDAVHDA